MITDDKYTMLFFCEDCNALLKTNSKTKTACIYMARSFGWSINRDTEKCHCPTHAPKAGRKSMAWRRIKETTNDIAG